MALLLRGGRVVDPAVGLDAVTDVLIRDGLVVEVGDGLTMPKGVVVACSGKVILPGLVDVPTHLREPGREAEETEWAQRITGAQHRHPLLKDRLGRIDRLG